jgi:hypothetical protein
MAHDLTARRLLRAVKPTKEDSFANAYNATVTLNGWKYQLRNEDDIGGLSFVTIRVNDIYLTGGAGPNPNFGAPVLKVAGVTRKLSSGQKQAMMGILKQVHQFFESAKHS